MREWPKWNSFWWSGSLLAIAWLPIPSFEVVAKLLHPNALSWHDGGPRYGMGDLDNSAILVYCGHFAHLQVFASS
jgi:hypothetical protein